MVLGGLEFRQLTLRLRSFTLRNFRLLLRSTCYRYPHIDSLEFNGVRAENREHAGCADHPTTGADHDRSALYASVLLRTLATEPIHRPSLVPRSSRGTPSERTIPKWKAPAYRVANSIFTGNAGLPRAYHRSDRMTAMLTLQRRHSSRCPNHNKPPDRKEKKCGCPLWACGMVDQRRVRLSLKTRDLQRAAR